MTIRLTFKAGGVQVKADGHAGETPACAMISALVYMLHGYCVNFGDVTECEMSPGKFRMVAYGDLRQVGLAFLIGCKQVAKTYPGIDVKSEDKETYFED